LSRPNIKHLFIVLGCIIIIAGCTPNIDQDLKKKNPNTSHIIEEYISRVGKRLLIVSDDPELPSLDIKFHFYNSNDQFFNVDLKTNKITVSKGMLEGLQNEAELAAILAIALETIGHRNLSNIDSNVINYMYKAGYDPMVFVELQEECLDNKKDPDYNWLETLFFPTELTTSKIEANKKLALTLPQGMQRAQQRYLSNIRMLKKLD